MRREGREVPAGRNAAVLASEPSRAQNDTPVLFHEERGLVARKPQRSFWDREGTG